MRRVLFFLTTALALSLPVGLAGPTVALADCVPLWEEVLTAGIAGAFCPFGAAPGVCDITQVGADVRRDDQGGRSDRFDYRFTPNSSCGDVHVTAGYSYRDGSTIETLEGNRRTIRAIWYCSDDPWTYDATPPTCSRDSVAVSGTDASNVDPNSILDATLPPSSEVLARVSRQALNGQLQNALKQSPAPAAVAPTPTPDPRPVRGTGAGGSPLHTPAIVDGWPLLNMYAMGGSVQSARYLLEAQGVTADDPPAPGNGTGYGVYMLATPGQVSGFQQAQGLPVTGVVDAATWQALIITVQAGDQGPAVKAVQSQLKSRGVDLMVDGDFGDQTAAAVQNYQHNQGLTVDGVVGPQIWQALVSGGRADET